MRLLRQSWTRSYLVISEADQDKNEDSLEAVEEGEEVGENDGLLGTGHVHEPENPRDTHHGHQPKGPRDPPLQMGPGVEVARVQRALQAHIPAHVVHGHGQEEDVGQHDQRHGDHEAEDEEVVRGEPAVGLGGVTAPVDAETDGDNHQGDPVAREVIPHLAGLFRLEDVYEHEPEIDSLEERPHESGQEKVVHQCGENVAAHRELGLIDAGQEEDLRDEQAKGEVFVDRGPFTLKTSSKWKKTPEKSQHMVMTSAKPVSPQARVLYTDQSTNQSTTDSIDESVKKKPANQSINERQSRWVSQEKAS